MTAVNKVDWSNYKPLYKVVKLKPEEATKLNEWFDEIIHTELINARLDEVAEMKEPLNNLSLKKMAPEIHEALQWMREYCDQRSDELRGTYPMTTSKEA